MLAIHQKRVRDIAGTGLQTHADLAETRPAFRMGQQGIEQRAMTSGRPQIVMVQKADKFPSGGRQTQIARG
jgi:hypothetical protein